MAHILLPIRSYLSSPRERRDAGIKSLAGKPPGDDVILRANGSSL
jgi:hypothetical protein